MPVTAPDEMITLDQAAERYGVSIYTLRNWRDRGQLSRYRRGDGRVVVSDHELREILEKRQRIVKEDD